jgi:hypothetical protein
MNGSTSKIRAKAKCSQEQQIWREFGIQGQTEKVPTLEHTGLRYNSLFQLHNTIISLIYSLTSNLSKYGKYSTTLSPVESQSTFLVNFDSAPAFEFATVVNNLVRVTNDATCVSVHNLLKNTPRLLGCVHVFTVGTMQYQILI